MKITATKNAKFQRTYEDKFRNFDVVLRYAPGSLTLEQRELFRSLSEQGAEADVDYLDASDSTDQIDAQ